MKSGNLNLLETPGPVQACNGIGLTLPALIWAGLVFLFPTHQFVSSALYSPYSLPYLESETIPTLSALRICLFSLYRIRAVQDLEFNSTVC